MPVTGYGRKRNTTDFSLNSVNTTSWLFDDEEETHPAQSKSTTTSPPTNRLSLQVGQTADGFPKLIRADTLSDFPSSAALELALAQAADPQPQVADRATGTRHRISLPPSALSGNLSIAPLNSILANTENKPTANNRRSMEVKFSAETKRPSLMASPPRGMATGVVPKPPSFSTNDIPTLKSLNGNHSNGIEAASPPTQKSTATDPTSPEHGGNLSRGASISNNLGHQSQEFVPSSKPEDTNGDQFHSHSGLQANAPPFGPMANGPENGIHAYGQNGMSPYAQPPYYPSYNMPPMQVLNNGFGGMSLNGGYGNQASWQTQPNMYGGQHGGYGGYNQYGGHGGQAVAGAGRFGENQRNNMQQRRVAQEEAIAKYNSLNVEELVGEIYSLCKDQHGCRFLQRKLDERDPKVIQTIFDEVKDHIIELMTDPFGNYLCQKLLECTDDGQRTVLIQNSSSSMTKIALNQHGTRALQKMIEFISTPEQTQLIIDALRYDVVPLIQDLNGNHVIQKCLNHLSSQDAQFIFDAVGVKCVAVGSHRHGCCVLQRCIDHASGLQKGALVDQVISNAYDLVQDPFGNYVVQYILDLAEPGFTEPLCRSFSGKVPFLSKQKFSSNVIEKCIRCADQDTKRALVLEILVPAELEKLLRDSYANYVVQTAMEFADEETKLALINNIRPILPSIRNTPYGRRIQTKISEYDARNSAASAASSAAASGITTPAEWGMYQQDMYPPPNGNNVMGPTNGQSNGLLSMNGNNPRSPPATTSSVRSPGTTASEQTAVPPQFGSQSAPVNRTNRHGWANGPPPQWRTPGPSAFSGPLPFGNGGTGYNSNGFSNGQNSANAIASPTPQRHGHSTSWFGGGDVDNTRDFAGPPRYGGNF
jgi:hypothetical protein